MRSCNKKRMHIVLLCACASTLFVLLAGTGAYAYYYSTCSDNKLTWDNARANMYISTTSFPAGTTWDARLQNAMWHWNNVKGSGFNFYVGRDTDGTHNNDNDVNEIYLDDTIGDALAVTHLRYHCYWLFGWRYGLDEADIEFNSDLSWSTNALDYNNLDSPFSFEGVALHELGHSLGLLHEDTRLATMNSYYPNSGPLGYYKTWNPLGDDRQGARFLYPDRTAEVDVAASAFKSIAPGSSGLVASPYYAPRGSRVTIEFTFTNLSTSTQTFDIGFYLSTNNLISTADTLLGANNGAWGGAGFTGTFTRTLYIPSTVETGTYYLGFLLDYTNSLIENDEGNNGQAMPHSVIVY